MKTYLTTIVVTIIFFSYIGCAPAKQTAPGNTKVAGNNKIASGNASLTETYWKLTELMGKTIATPADAKEVHLKFRKENNRLEGFAGCNTLMGSYALTSPQRITFTAGSTRMMCAGERMEVENNLMKILGMADSYLIKGNTLQLFKARMAPLAKLEAVYFE